MIKPFCLPEFVVFVGDGGGKGHRRGDCYDGPLATPA